MSQKRGARQLNDEVRAEGEGVEPTGPVEVTVFKTVAIDHSATLPEDCIVHVTTFNLHAHRAIVSLYDWCHEK